jgi:phosphonate transport system substrate-binding protein
LLHTEVKGVLSESYAELAESLERDRVQYAWMSPALMVLTSERIQLQPLLSAVRNDRADYCSALFVDADGPAHDLEALRGKTVAWVDPASAAGYLLPRIHLAAHGIDPADLFGEEIFAGSHAEVVKAVASGRAAIGATYAELPHEGEPLKRAGFLDVAPDREMRVLEWTQAIPNDVIVGHGLIGKAEHRVFGNAMLTLAERVDGRRMLSNMFQTERFMTTPRNALRPLWTLVEVARARGLLAQM